ncbi:HAD-IC family P-type ATPase [Collinsella sp. zg1085]|nr:HAD-IC family P-type ATPase [Collinsella sp. zg1085]
MLDTQTPLTGLSSSEVEERILAGQVNRRVELKTKSIKQLIIENLCTVFNLINLMLALLVISTGSWKNLTFLGVVILNTGIGMAQAIRSKRMVDRLTLLTTHQARVMRDGKEQRIDLEAIVRDDIIRLGRGDQIPADAVVVSGSCQVNEGLLTGESNLIEKTLGSPLMSGSFVDAGTVLAQVIHVGTDNYVAKINMEAKYVKQVNSEIMSTLQHIVRFAGALMLPIGIALFIASAHKLYVLSGGAVDSPSMLTWLLNQVQQGRVLDSAILSTVGALLGMIPQGLVLLTSSVLAIATVRLARRHVLAQQLYCIETLARVDVLCLDKTGTITSGAMHVEDIHLLEIHDAAGAQSPSLVYLSDLQQILTSLAHAHADDPNETGKALLAYARAHALVPWNAQQLIPFSSAKKWSGASFAEGCFVMGAAQFILDASSVNALAPQLEKLSAHARVLVLAEVDGFDAQGDIQGAARPLGFVSITDEIRASAPETIAYFIEQGVKLMVISGDDPRTVAHIAKHVGIPHADAWVDATTLQSDDDIREACAGKCIFGRVTPQQKRSLVSALKAAGHTVAMTGDGVNDVLALKEADCSIAMAAGSDAARNVAELVLVKNDFAAMPEVVAEGRRSINNLQRSAALFLTKTLFSAGLAALCIFLPPYPFNPLQMTLINLFCIGLPGFVLGLEPNHERVQGSFIVHVVRHAAPASLAVMVGACVAKAFTPLFGLSLLELSTASLIATALVGLCLIIRLAQPLTALRLVLIVVVVAGLLTGIIGLRDFYGIALLTPSTLAVTALASMGAVVSYLGARLLFARYGARIESWLMLQTRARSVTN